MKGKTYIIATRDFTYINLVYIPWNGYIFSAPIWFTQNYHSHFWKERHRRLQYILLVSRSPILTSNLRRPVRDHFNKNILIEKHYEVCLILIKEVFRFRFNPEMFSRFQEMNKPKLYASCNELSTRESGKVISEYINSMSWKPGDRVLDMGCGPGNVTTEVLMPRLPADFGLLIGADMSADMIQYATETYTHSKLRFTQFDLLKDIGKSSQLQPSYFDKIFCFFLLHWIPDHRYYLAIKLWFDS